MNQSKKLELSKETLRCLDDQDLTDIVGGGDGGDKGRGGNNQSFVLGVVGCISNNNCFNSNGGGNALIGGVCL